MHSWARVYVSVQPPSDHLMIQAHDDLAASTLIDLTEGDVTASPRSEIRFPGYGYRFCLIGQPRVGSGPGLSTHVRRAVIDLPQVGSAPMIHSMAVAMPAATPSKDRQSNKHVHGSFAKSVFYLIRCKLSVLNEVSQFTDGRCIVVRSMMQVSSFSKSQIFQVIVRHKRRSHKRQFSFRGIEDGAVGSISLGNDIMSLS